MKNLEEHIDNMLWSNINSVLIHFLSINVKKDVKEFVGTNISAKINNTISKTTMNLIDNIDYEKP